MTLHASPPPDPSEPLQVLLLGPLRVSLRTETCSVPCPADGSQAAFWSSMLERFPDLDAACSSIRLARNSEFLQPQDRLQPGDEIALIPPVSGG